MKSKVYSIFFYVHLKMKYKYLINIKFNKKMKIEKLKFDSILFFDFSK
jgi:hypothetical protein